MASTAYGMKPPSTRDEKGRGRRVLSQVLLSMIFSCGLLAFGAGLMGSQYMDVEGLKQSTRVGDLLTQTLDEISAYSFKAISEMDGRSIIEQSGPENSGYRVDLAVTPAGNGLLKIRAIILDNRTSRELTRVVTWRGRG